jgi:hypothetical protein
MQYLQNACLVWWMPGGCMGEWVAGQASSYIEYLLCVIYSSHTFRLTFSNLWIVVMDTLKNCACDFLEILWTQWRCAYDSAFSYFKASIIWASFIVHTILELSARIRFQFLDKSKRIKWDMHLWAIFHSRAGTIQPLADLICITIP